MYKLEYVGGEVRRTLTKTFYQVRREATPLFDHLKMSDITVKWWIKRPDDKHVMGICFRGNWMITTKSLKGRKMRNHFRNLIILDKRYYENNGIDDLIGVWKHELVHLVAKDRHGSHFMTLAKGIGAKRYCSPHKSSNTAEEK